MMKFGSYDVTVESFSSNVEVSKEHMIRQGDVIDDCDDDKIYLDGSSETASLNEESDRKSDEISIISGDDSLDKVEIDTGKGMVSFQPLGSGEVGIDYDKSSPNQRRPQRKLPSTPTVTFEENNDEGTISKDMTTADNEKGATTSKYNSIPRSKKQHKSKSKFYTHVDIKLPGNTSSIDSTNKQPDDDNPVQDVRKTSSSSNLEISGTVDKHSASLLRGLRPSTSESSVREKSSKKAMTLSKGGSNLVSLRQTHIGIFSFIPRHKDEMQFNEGDPLHIVKLHEDFWYEGINLISGKQGIFPCRYAADILSQDGVSEAKQGGDQFFLRFLGSVEVADFKGEEILCVAISKVVNQHKMLSTLAPQTCTLQVSTKGIRISEMHGKMNNVKGSPKVGRSKKTKGNAQMEVEASAKGTHFFSMKNVTYCGNHPRDRRYFAFITKHPNEHRYACHVFMSQYSTEQVTSAVGACFKKFYDDYLEYRAPTEDIYIE